MNGIYEQLADLLEYPAQSWEANALATCKDLLNSSCTELPTSFTTFCEATQDLSLSSLQEIYTRTFDLNPVCALDIGYHLFGENYKRGVFLANLRETEAPFDLGQDHQLPDYLPVLLRLLSKLENKELRAALMVDCMIPALDKMQKALGDSDNPYRHLLAVVRASLQLEALVDCSEPAERDSFKRAGLPILTIDPRNSASESLVGSSEFVTCDLFNLKTHRDLF